MKNENKNSKMTLDKLAVIFAGSFKGFEKRLTSKIDGMATKDGLKDLDTKIEQVRVDLQSFKQETRENFKGVKKDIKDLTETVEDVTFNHESRIEVLEKA